MIFSINKSKMTVVIISVIITVCMLVVSCTNGVTTTKDMESNKSVVSGMTKQQFVFLNYLQQLDENVVLSNLKELKATASSTGSRSSCCIPTIRMIVDNLHNILDEELWYEILLLSGLLFDCEGNIVSPFSPEIRATFLALLGDRADEPACDFDFSLLGVSTNPENSVFSGDELNHFNNLLHLINDDNTSFDNVLSFLNNTYDNPRFTDGYRLVLSSAFNALDYFIDNDLGFSMRLFRSVLIVEITIMISNPNGGNHIMILPIFSKVILKLTGPPVEITTSSIVIPCECDTCECCD